MNRPLFIRSGKQTFAAVKMSNVIKPSAGSTVVSTVSLRENIMDIHAILSLIFWYIFSFLTLFMNKYTLDALQAEPFLFSTVQLLVSTIFGGINMRYPCYMGRASTDIQLKPLRFYFNMACVGVTRFLVVFLSLISLQYVAVSFTETVKSSAPLFTVLISWLMLGEKNGLYVQLSLMPIMTGLMLCSVYELSFTMIGFLAALGTNIAECLQFVLSKMYISSFVSKTTLVLSSNSDVSIKIEVIFRNLKPTADDNLNEIPAEFQFYSCFGAIIVQLPICLICMDYELASKTTFLSFVWMVLNGIAYHIQTMTAWVLMLYLSPVTHSVCNTVKRAIAIWLSVLVFGNDITFLSGVGTTVVIIGVFLYNRARHYEQYLHQHAPKVSARSTHSADNGSSSMIVEL